MTTKQNAAEGTQSTEEKPVKIGRRMSEDDIREKIDNRGRPVTFLPGTLTYVTEKVAARTPELADHIGKQVVQKECESTGKLFHVATSDLHQCFYAPSERRKMRNLKAKERRVAKKAKQEELQEELDLLKAEASDQASEAASA